MHHLEGIIDAEDAAWVWQIFLNITAFDVGKGIHFVQEDHPHFIGEKLAQWRAQLN